MNVINNNVAVIGLGLIGGSMAKAIKQTGNFQVFGKDINDTTVKKAILVNAIDEELNDEILSECSLIIIALYPNDTVEFLRENASSIKKDAIVIDCCGVKEYVCNQCEPIANDHGFIFMGGHPMAGVAHGGFEYSQKNMFENASMILTPATGTPIAIVDSIKKFFGSLGFSNIQIASSKEHDMKIAFTSQLAHVVSNAYVKSPCAKSHSGFSAGSYKDLSRVAKLNETMWAELFLKNPDCLITEIDNLVDRLKEYRSAIAENDFDSLKKLLLDGKEQKMLIDGEIF